MHELAVCQALMQQVEAVASEHQAAHVTAITLGIGPLSGVEHELLRHAYPVAAAGTVAEGAQLHIQTTPVRIHCKTCDRESEARVNKLVCEHCGDWRTELVSGDELLLITIEMDRDTTPATSGDKLH